MDFKEILENLLPKYKACKEELDNYNDLFLAKMYLNDNHLHAGICWAAYSWYRGGIDYHMSKYRPETSEGLFFFPCAIDASHINEMKECLQFRIDLIEQILTKHDK